MNDKGINAAKMSINDYRRMHKGADPTSDMTANYFIETDAFYELKFDSQNKKWRLTEYKKTEEAVIDA